MGDSDSVPDHNSSFYSDVSQGKANKYCSKMALAFRSKRTPPNKIQDAGDIKR